MSRIFKRALASALVLACISAAAAAIAQATVSGDVYDAGGSVRVASEVDGDVVVAGGRLSILESVSQDVLAAGGLVTVAAETGDDLRLAGGAVSILGDVGSDVMAAGGWITLESGSTVDGHAWLSGRFVDVYGDVKGTLHASGGRIRLAGTIGGDVEIDAEAIEIEPGAVIKGSLTYAAPKEVVVGEGAVVQGEIERVEFALGEVETWGPALGSALKASVVLVLSTVAFYLLFSRFSEALVGRVDDSLLKSLGLGLSVLAATPVLVILLLFSGWATLPAFLLLSAYLATLIVGWFVGVLWLGDVALRLLGRVPDASKWSRAGSVVVAAFILLVVGAIPYVGGLFGFATLLLGLGATSQQLYQTYRG